MALFSIEHGKAAYRADVMTYAAAVLLLATWLLVRGPHAQWVLLVACTVAGLGGWTVIEYGMHRFILHGPKPFSRWHGLHHQHPTALIFTSTLVSACSITGLLFLPALLWTDVWRASALTLGVLIGYLAYSITHHATHHGRASNAWLRQRKRWHALHHHADDQHACYGVTTSLWDRVFGSTRRAAHPAG